jgi:hypothetical protein
VHTVAETYAYLADAKDAGMDEDDRKRVVDFLAVNPDAGHLIKNSGGVRKVRIAKEGGGKSGGYRVLTGYVGPEAPVYLLAAYAKNDRDNISAAERNALAEVMELIKAEFRQRRR